MMLKKEEKRRKEEDKEYIDKRKNNHCSVNERGLLPYDRGYMICYCKSCSEEPMCEYCFKNCHKKCNKLQKFTDYSINPTICSCATYLGHKVVDSDKKKTSSFEESTLKDVYFKPPLEIPDRDKAFYHRSLFKYCRNWMALYKEKEINYYCANNLPLYIFIPSIITLVRKYFSC